MKNNLPVLGFAAFSGTGKTTLLKQLIPLLAQRGIRVGVIKHAHHNFDIDTPGDARARSEKAPMAPVIFSRRMTLASPGPGEASTPISAVVSRFPANSTCWPVVTSSPAARAFCRHR
ncbi:MAG: molybdopterin-guanine dinucleotide biosynthesis protein MobB [Gammaproteobacteria bacterium]